jgi:hypothetical protein
MTFKELRPDIQTIAALALRHHVESGYYEEGKTVGVAKDIKAAFVELFSDDTTNQSIEGAAGAIAQAITLHLNVADDSNAKFENIPSSIKGLTRILSNVCLRNSDVTIPSDEATNMCRDIEAALIALYEGEKQAHPCA